MKNNRLLLIVIAVFCFFILLLLNLFHIQVIKNEEHKYTAQRQQTGLEKIPAERGMIYDRDNILLAYNRNDVSLWVDIFTAKERDKKRISGLLAKHIGGDSTEYYNRILSAKNRFAIVKKIEREKALPLKNVVVSGLKWVEDPTRIYQYNNLASHILGYVDVEYKGVDGIERRFNDLLTGDDGYRYFVRSAGGQMITVEEEETKPSVAGENILLTIKKSYQSILEEELQKGMESYKARNAAGILMNPNTGEIFAMANSTGYDLNNYWEFQNDVRRNKLLTDTYEPGSTFKAVSLALLLDNNYTRESEQIFAEHGSYQIRNARIRDTKSHGMLTVKELFEQSSNIGMAKLVDRINNEEFYKHLRSFGFGNQTGILLPGEAKGNLRKPGDWSALSKYFLSFGYEISVTPLQMITAFSSIINGGLLYEPQIIKARYSRDGARTFEYSPKLVRRVISTETSEKMKKLLVSVVENGTAKRAKLNSVFSGGKTGTSQQLVEGKYSKQKYNSSYIGFFPAENPQIVCFVLIDAPQQGVYGGAVAAPIFKNIAERIINTNSNDFIEPEIKNVNKGDFVYASQTITETLNERNITVKTVNTIKNDVMPDLKNYSLREAIQILTQLGLEYEVKGTGSIKDQSISAGVRIAPGMKCILYCIESTIKGTAIN